MNIYLPIAELSVPIVGLLAIGAIAGFCSGLFGVGGGFLMIPLLIFYNIPPAIAVGTGANQIIASSAMGALTHFKRRTLDIKLGILLVISGVAGSFFGIQIFAFLRHMGQLDLLIAILYVLLLSIVGILMVIESHRALLRVRSGKSSSIRRPGQHIWLHRLPFKTKFRTSMIYISIIPVLLIGGGIGILSSIMGIGGGFIMVPALIYFLRIPTLVVIGTSLFQITFVSIFTTIMQSVTNHSVDIILALFLMIGGVIGAQYGMRMGQKLRSEQLRLLLALLILGIALWLAFRLFIRPDDLFTLTLGTR